MNKFLYFFTRIGFWPYVFIFTVLAIVLSEILMLFQSYWLTGSWFDKNLMIVGFITPAIDAFIVFFLSALIIRHLVALKNESEKTSLELSEQKKALNDYINLSTDFVWEVDTTGKYTFVSNGVKSILGYESDELIGKTPFDFMDKEEAQRVSSEFTLIIKDTLPINDLENWNISKSGERVCLLTNGIPIFDNNNTFIGYRGTDKNITVSKELAMKVQIQKDELEKQKLLYQQLMTFASDGVAITDLQGKVIECSIEAAKMLGYSMDEMKSLSLYDWDKNYSKEEAIEYISKIPYEQISVETQHTRKDGSIYDASVTAIKTKIDGKEFIYSTVRNITQMKRQEKELQENEAKLRGLFELSPIGIALTNVEGKYIEFNEAFKNICGYEREELNQLDYWKLTPKKYKDDEIKQLKSLNDTGFYGPYEKEYIQKDGTLISIRLNGMFITGSDEQQYTWSIVEDISDQKRVETELRNAKELAELASQSKSDFLANMSHEIRTPMTGMLGFIERLVKDEKDSERLKQLKVVENSGNTLLTIINDILDFSKIESGKLELESSPFNIRELCQVSTDMFLSLASDKNITLHKLSDDNIPLCIIGDETRFKQVVFNLMSNAIKFTSDGGKITLQMHYNEDAKAIHIAVVDTGVGIAKENLDKIFEAFSQEDISTTRKFGGTGLGLSISSHLVRLMGSELKVESQVGKGSKFYFDLPIEICTHKDGLDIEDANATSTDRLDINGHVLVVEDNKTNQMLMSMILDELDLTYDIANNGAEGVLNFKLNKYDLILMDENMPIMNGIESTKNIREIELDKELTKIPIIAVTANALTGDKEKFLEAGMSDYIAKPYSEEDIIKVLNKYLG